MIIRLALAYLAAALAVSVPGLVAASVAVVKTWRELAARDSATN